MSVFNDLPVARPSTEATLLAAFRRDSHQDKVYLAGREYEGGSGQATRLPLIWKIKQQMDTDPTLHPERPPPLGLPEFSRRASGLALGKDSPALVENRVVGVQTVGSCGAVRLGAELLKLCCSASSSWSGPVLLASPCDESLPSIFEAAGIKDVQHYRYWDSERRGVGVEKMLEDLEEAPEQSVVVLSASGHYPTGADLSQEEWKRVIDVLVVQVSTKLKQDESSCSIVPSVGQVQIVTV